MLLKTRYANYEECGDELQLIVIKQCFPAKLDYTSSQKDLLQVGVILQHLNMILIKYDPLKTLNLSGSMWY